MRTPLIMLCRPALSGVCIKECSSAPYPVIFSTALKIRTLIAAPLSSFGVHGFENCLPDQVIAQIVILLPAIDDQRPLADRPILTQVIDVLAGMIDLHIYDFFELAGRQPDGILVTGAVRASADELDYDFGHSDIPDLSARKHLP